MQVSAQVNGINDFCFNKEGKLHLRSRFSRFLSAVLPFYYQGKVDSTAKEVLNQLKNDYLKHSSSNLTLAFRVLELNPSREIASEIKAYARALSGKSDCQAGQFGDVEIAPELSQRLEKLSLTAEQQTRYPELMKMIEVNELVDYMEGVNWKIENDHWEGQHLSFASEGCSEPILFLNGQPKPWSAARDEIFGADLNASTSWKLPKEWRFDSNGITHHQVADWEQLTPCGKLRGHDGCFYLDIMSTTEGLNHNWIRLVDDKGEVISAGLCGEIYSWAMMRSSVGKLNSPDHREFFKPNTHRTTRILIDADTFQSIKSRKIETDQKTHNLFFSLLTRNCSRYACEVAAEAGLHLDNSEFASQLVVRNLLQKINLRPPTKVLEIIQKITLIVRAIFATGLAFVMGAWYQNPDVSGLEKSYSHLWTVQPRKPFRSLRSFINGTNSFMASSMKVGAWQEFVANYRSVRKKYVECRKVELGRTEYFQDPEFQTKWLELERQAAYGMPPRLDNTHLFLNDMDNISTEDLEDHIGRLTAR